VNYTSQDYYAIEEEKRSYFLLRIIEDYQNSHEYRTAIRAQQYYRRRNPNVLARMSYLERTRRRKINVKFHRLCSGWFRKLIVHANGYLLGNGVSLSDENKTKLGNRFDKILLQMGNNALVDGVCWGYWDVEQGLVPFRSAEVGKGFIMLQDERTGTPTVGIRYWQLTLNKPLYIAVYERDGVTEYIARDEKINLYTEKIPYMTRIGTSPAAGSQIIGIENHDVLPIFPLYANELKQSEIVGLDGYIDAYDFIASDMVDSITMVDGLYSIVKNYGGDDLEQLVQEIHEKKIIYADGDNAGGSFDAIETPYMSKKEALSFLEQRITIDFMVPSSMSGRAATATEINLNREPLDFKADLFELQVIDFVENVLHLIGIDEEPKFKRRTTTNDTEITNAVNVMRPDLSLKTALKLYPLLPDDLIEENITELALEELGRDADLNEPVEIPPGEAATEEEGAR